MKRFILTATLVAALVVPAAGGAAPGPNTRGSGDVGTGQDFSFSASGVGFGADGHIRVTFPGQDPNQVFAGQVNCLSIVNNQATMTGNITRIRPAQNPATAPTDFLAFAEDNGEPGEFRDRFFFTTFTPTPTFNPTCLVPVFGFFGSLITDGNIEVDPS
jgi:hypothetical protein